MYGTSMPMNDSSSSSTFSSAYINLFSDLSIPTANGLSCPQPFSYKFQESYYIWVLWCPLSPLSTNQIVIPYPLYPNALGAEFPFDLAFSYSYCNSNG